MTERTLRPRYVPAAIGGLTLFVLLLVSCSGSEPSEPGLELLAIGPSEIHPGFGPLFLTAHGTGFQDGAVVERDDTALETTFLSDTRIAAVLSREDVELPDTFTIRVRNPGGERSRGLRLIVSPDAQSFSIDSTTPASEAEVNADTPLAVYLSETLDIASVRDTSIVLRDETGTRVSGVVSYDEEVHALRWSGVLSPARRYTVSLADDLRTPEGGAISGSLTWPFTTTLGVTVLLEPTGAWPAMVPGPNGWPRVAYRSPSRLRLATCTGSCATPGLWGIADVGQLAGADYVSLAMDGTGNLHFGFQDPSGFGAMYATASGQSVAIEGDAAFTSIGASALGRLHLLYYRGGDLHAATCATDCATFENWQITEVDTDGNAGSFPSVTVDPQGGVHTTYFENDSGDLRYAVCAAPCTTPSWTSGPVDTDGRTGIGSSLLVDGTGRRHASWIDSDQGDVVYGTCSADCTTESGWSRAVVEHVVEPASFFGFGYTSLALSPNGLELSYFDAIGGRLRGASCTSDCSTAGSWTTFTVSLHSPAGLGSWTSLKVDHGGQRHVAWIDRTDGVRYTRY